MAAQPDSVDMDASLAFEDKTAFQDDSYGLADLELALDETDPYDEKDILLINPDRFADIEVISPAGQPDVVGLDDQSDSGIESDDSDADENSSNINGGEPFKFDLVGSAFSNNDFTEKIKAAVKWVNESDNRVLKVKVQEFERLLHFVASQQLDYEPTSVQFKATEYMELAGQEFTQRGIPLPGLEPVNNSIQQAQENDKLYLLDLAADLLYMRNTCNIHVEAQCIKSRENSASLEERCRTAFSQMIDRMFGFLLQDTGFGHREVFTVTERKTARTDFMKYVVFIMSRTKGNSIPTCRDAHNTSLREHVAALQGMSGKLSKNRIYDAFTGNRKVLLAAHAVKEKVRSIVRWLKRLSIFSWTDRQIASICGVEPSSGSLDEISADESSTTRRWPIMKRDLGVYFKHLAVSSWTIHPTDVTEISFCLISLYTGARISEIVPIARHPDSGVRLKNVEFKKRSGILGVLFAVDCYKRLSTSSDKTPIRYYIEETRTLLCPDQLMTKIAQILNVDRRLISHRSFRKGYALETAYSYVMKHGGAAEYEDVVFHLQQGVQWYSEVCTVYLNHGDQMFQNTLGDYKKNASSADIRILHKYLSQLGDDCQLLKIGHDLSDILGRYFFSIACDVINALIIDRNDRLGPAPPDEEQNVLLDIDGILGLSSPTYNSDISNLRLVRLNIREEDLFKPAPRPYSHICDICGRLTSCGYDFMKHKLTHSDVRTYVCPKDGCEKSFKNIDGLRAHKMFCLKQNVLICDICGQRVYKYSALKIHKLTHSDVRSYVCPNDGCGKCFKTSTVLGIHKKFCLKQNVLNCDICERRFVTLSDLRRHNLTHSDVRSYVCPKEECGKAFKTADGLRMHKKGCFQQNVHVCDICGRQFSRSCTLRKHMSIHSDVRSYVCPVEGCGKAFKTADLMRSHTKNCSQEKIKQNIHVCYICGRRFATPNDLKMHMLVHSKDSADSSEERSPVCLREGCGKSFKTLRGVRAHIWICLGLQAHVCGGCGRNFGTSYGLNRHLKTCRSGDAYKNCN